MGQLVVECDRCLGRGSCGECYAPIRLLPFLLLLLLLLYCNWDCRDPLAPHVWAAAPTARPGPRNAVMYAALWTHNSNPGCCTVSSTLRNRSRLAGQGMAAGIVYKRGGSVLDKTHPPDFGPTPLTFDPPRPPPLL